MIRKRTVTTLFAGLVTAVGLCLALPGNAGAASQDCEAPAQLSGVSAPFVWWCEGYYMTWQECRDTGVAYVGAQGAKAWACDEVGPANYPWRLRILD
ncbi:MULTISPECIES: hypothetical protein [Nonomuraea]|uniref:Uncharacterized protein n=1 Tax=Nonomuraea harbinensis TaxID=1286938 RepID=A0ABW1BN10_9ACTN|nr:MULTISPECIES: hypothetical protein [Nonomuraea]TXK39591.1 hypothetical protein FR742_08280 [Nonomuraea sp. C10]